MRPLAPLGILIPLAVYVGCSTSSSPWQPTTPNIQVDGTEASTLDLPDLPIRGLPADFVARHNEGDALFDTPFRESDGLGPLYIRDHCASCHSEASRGPGLVQTMVAVESDGVTPVADQTSKLPYGHLARPLLAAGAKTALLPPPGDKSINVSIRIGMPLLGHGYMEAVLDSEIERVEREQKERTDGIHGRINRVTFTSEANPDKTFFTYKKGDSNLVGRFGVKARTATLDDFIAGALLGDIGITSPMRPDELANPDGLKDDKKQGVDTTMEIVNSLAFYVRTLAIPRRDITDEGRAIFDKAKCNVCHVPTLKTRADYPIKLLAGIDAPVYTDFLLHDWGNESADGMTDQQAGPRMWRTAPLIGLRFNKTFLHDGRAKSIQEAIELHASPGSEPDVSARLFFKLSSDERKKLIDFVSAL